MVSKGRGFRDKHIILDDPGRFELHPKDNKRTRRAPTQNQQHEHLVFSDHTKVPAEWREIISCRMCKCNLVIYTGESLLQTGPEFLHGDQKLFVVG